MLRFDVHEGHLQYANGYNAEPMSVTRYFGERWEQVASDILCGIADVFQDVGLVTIGRSTSRSRRSVKCYSLTPDENERLELDRWVPIDAGERVHKAVYSLSEEYGELYVPDCREAVEQIAEWVMFAPVNEEGYRSIAFPGYRDFRKRLDGESWNVHNGDLAAFANEMCVEKAYFQMLWGPGVGWHFPGSIELTHLIRLMDPVVARINTTLSE
jgi:hypothetical protein